MMARRFRTSLALARLAFPFGLFLILRRLVSLERLVRWAWHVPIGARHPAQERQIAEHIDRLSRLTKARGDCLPKSLLLYRELSKRNADPQLMIGFSHRREPFCGHAWVVVDGQPLGESAAMLASLATVCAFGRDGRLLPAS